MLIDRMIRAAKLEVALYEEVEADTTATSQALTIVIIASICGGIGSMLLQVMERQEAGAIVKGLILGIIAALLFWIIWSFLAYWVGTKFFGGTATYGELLRCIGFAYSPAVLNILRFIPFLGGVINLVVSIWLLVAGVIAVRQALDVTTGKAIAVSVIGWIVGVIVMGIILAGFGGLAMM